MLQPAEIQSLLVAHELFGYAVHHALRALLHRTWPLLAGRVLDQRHARLRPDPGLPSPQPASIPRQGLFGAARLNGTPLRQLALPAPNFVKYFDISRRWSAAERAELDSRLARAHVLPDLPHHSHARTLTRKLIERGFADDQIAQILYGDWMRVLAQVRTGERGAMRTTTLPLPVMVSEAKPGPEIAWSFGEGAERRSA
jgi:hypothetical protein